MSDTGNVNIYTISTFRYNDGDYGMGTGSRRLRQPLSVRIPSPIIYAHTFPLPLSTRGDESAHSLTESGLKSMSCVRHFRCFCIIH